MRWLDGTTNSMDNEFEQALGDSEGQGSLASCSPWGCIEQDTAQRLYTTINEMQSASYVDLTSCSIAKPVFYVQQFFLWNLQCSLHTKSDHLHIQFHSSLSHNGSDFLVAVVWLDPPVLSWTAVLRFAVFALFVILEERIPSLTTEWDVS